MKKTQNGSIQFIQENKMQFFLLSLSTIVTIANLYIATLLSPLKSDIGRIESVMAEDHERVQLLSEKMVGIDICRISLEDIDSRLERIENFLYGGVFKK